MENKYVKRGILLIGIVMFSIFLGSIGSGQFPDYQSGSFSSSYSYIGGGYNVQYYRPSFQQYYTSSQISTYWKLFEKDDCRARQDFIIQIPPGGCSPAVVRSDLLEEQNVPVFCRLDALKLNPLINVEAIESITFKGKYPAEVVGVSFHPARAALRTNERLLGSPLLNNIGYVVILLKRNEVEDDMPDFVHGNLTAVISYDLEKAFGVGRAEFIIPQLDEDLWRRDYKEYGFWNGKGFLKADFIEKDKVRLSVYSSKDNRVSQITLDKGETSNEIFLPGYYCQTALQLRLNDITYPEEKVKIRVSSEDVTDDFWLFEGGRFADSNCRVLSIDADDFGGGSATIRCPRETFTLELRISDKLLFNDKEYELWQEIEDIEDIEDIEGNVYPVYSGKLPKNIDIDEKQFVITIQTDEEINEGLKINVETKLKEILNVIGKKETIIDLANFKTSLSNAVKAIDNKITGALVLVEEDSLAGEIKFEGFAKNDLVFESDKKDLLNEYFEKATQEAVDLVQRYPLEESESKQVYGEEVLIEAAQLASKLHQFETERTLYHELIRNYPNSAYAIIAEERLKEISLYSRANATKTIFIDDELYTIKLVDIEKPTKDEASAELVISDGIIETLRVGIDEIFKFEGDNKDNADYYKLIELDEEFVRIERNFIIEGNKWGSEIKTVYLGKTEVFDGRTIKYNKANLVRVAKVSVSPKIVAATGEVNFSYHIGIEKRGIQLSPEKTQDMINNLNNTIEKWDNINERLIDLVKVMRGTCFATSTVLVVKNLLQGFSGETMARQAVMRGENGWIEKCNDMLHQYSSLDECLLDKNDEIEEQVKLMQEIYGNVNEGIEKASEGHTTKDMFGLGSVVNTEEATEDYMKNNFLGVVENQKGIQLDLDGDGKVDESLGEVFEGYEEQDSEDVIREMVSNSDLTWEQMKEIDVWTRFYQQADDTGKELAKTRLTGILNNVKEARTDTIARLNANTDFGQDVEKTGLIPFIGSSRERNDLPVSMVMLTNDNNYGIEDSNYASQGGVYYEKDDNGKTGSPLRVMAFSIPQTSGSFSDNEGEKRIYEAISGKSFFAVMKLSTSGTYEILDVYRAENGQAEKKLDAREKEQVVNYFGKEVGVSSFTAMTYETCNNNYDKPEVRYFETPPYQNMPAIVPVDVKRGWYAAIKQTLPILGNIQPYEDSGRVTSFYLCNVGKNGKEDFYSGLRDDICTMVNLNTRQPLDSLGCVSPDEARKLINLAVRNVQEAAEQAGNKAIRLPSGTFYTGKPPAAVTGTQCQDYMSPKECHLLFNVCDPVICPPSRCNLGGAYYVDDVIQSGIVGSIFLCLPNIKEKIMIPVCVSGIQAGIDGYLSILKSKKDCLIESLETGRHVGICDELHSIYLCEFFWRQFAPVMKELLPKLISFAYGQGTRGGGEYLLVQHAWDTTQKSINYIKDYYAVNAFEAFRLRSTDEVGTEFCKAFIGTRYPNDIDVLLEPESPPQYHAWFDEIPFTSATLPATSHYKVFYHIYAGKEQGGAYSVYLQSPPDSGFYESIGRIVVKSGYIAKGEYATETIDMTAPAGYTELCVRINMEEECGFGKVSTSFAVDYLSEKYIQEQATEKVQTEKACISGTSSLYSLANPNLQAGVEEAAMPELYKKGIVRVCSSINPGKQTDPDRWKDVGYCDDNKIRCWLDTNTVKENIKNKDILAETIGDIPNEELQRLVENKEALSEKETRARLGNVREGINELRESLENDLSKSGIETKITSLISELDEIEKIGLFNQYRAQAKSMKFEIYKIVSETIFRRGGFADEVQVKSMGTSTDAEGEADAQEGEGDADTDADGGEVINNGDCEILSIKIDNREIQPNNLIVVSKVDEIIINGNGNCLPDLVGKFRIWESEDKTSYVEIYDNAKDESPYKFNNNNKIVFDADKKEVEFQDKWFYSFGKDPKFNFKKNEAEGKISNIQLIQNDRVISSNEPVVNLYDLEVSFEKKL